MGFFHKKNFMLKCKYGTLDNKTAYNEALIQIQFSQNSRDHVSQLDYQKSLTVLRYSMSEYFVKLTEKQKRQKINF